MSNIFNFHNNFKNRIGLGWVVNSVSRLTGQKRKKSTRELTRILGFWKIQPNPTEKIYNSTQYLWFVLCSRN